MTLSSIAISDELKNQISARVYEIIKQSGGVSAGYNLPQIKEIAAENKAAFPIEFMRLCMMESYYNVFRHRLVLNDRDVDSYNYDGDLNWFVETFSWFVSEFGSRISPGYHCNGKTKDELSGHFRRSDAMWMNRYFASKGKCSSETLARLDVNCAKIMVDSFIDIKRFREGMELYILQACFETDAHSKACRWEKLQYMLARCRCEENQQGIILNQDSPAPSKHFVTMEGGTQNETHELRSLSGHLLIWILLHPALYTASFDASNVKRCLLFINKHQPSAFLVRNQEGRTLLDVILIACISSQVCGGVVTDKVVTKQQWEELAFFVLEVSPKACLIPNLDGNRAFDTMFYSNIFSPELFKAVAIASAPLVSSRCMLKSCRRSKLYPFLLAGDDTSKIYQLLRQTPNLIKSALSVLPCDTTDSAASVRPSPETTTLLPAMDGGSKKRKASDDRLY